MSPNIEECEKEENAPDQATVMCADCECEIHTPSASTRSYLLKKVQGRASWIIAMLFLGSMDLILNWLNYLDLNIRELHHGIVVGSVPFVKRIILLVFTLLHTVLFVPETLNTLSAICFKGITIFPVVYEMIGTIILVHIPINGINYFTTRCRGEHATMLQTMVSSSTIMYVFLRMVWYAHMEGMWWKKHGDVKINKLFFMLVCALFSVSMAFPVMMWRNVPDLILESRHVHDVSIFLLKAPFLEKKRVTNKPFDDLLVQQGHDLKEPYLVKSLEMITAQPYHDAIFKCNYNATFQPLECVNNTEIHFRFVYTHYSEANPYGEIIYNYGLLPAQHDDDLGNMTCVPAEKPLLSRWTLFYYEASVFTFNGDWHVNVTSPWNTCLTPTPWYDSSVNPCRETHVT